MHTPTEGLRMFIRDPIINYHSNVWDFPSPTYEFVRVWHHGIFSFTIYNLKMLEEIHNIKFFNKVGLLFIFAFNVCLRNSFSVSYM